MRKKFLNLYRMVIVVLIGTVCFACWKIGEIIADYKKGTDLYRAIGQLVTLTPETRESTNDFGDNTEIGPTSAGMLNDERPLTIVWPEVDFEVLRSINSDFAGWLYIDGTEINYPFVQGKDNNYYLKHLFSGEWNDAGCVFLDSRNKSDFTDCNSILYGHHMKNGTMFSSLTDFKRQEYYEEHKTAFLLTPEKNFQIEFFAGYVATVNDDAWRVDFTNNEFEAWCMRAKEKSCFTSGVTPKNTDRIITLSTCSYEFFNARFVLLGIIK